VLIAGMTLPESLVAAIAEGRWRVPDDKERLEAVFGCKAVDPCFYSLQGIRNETERWHAESDSDTLGQYLGQSNAVERPGDIIQDRSIFIGDLGPDMPFALDYRQSDRVFSVIFLTIYGGWREVASSAAALISSLGLDRPAL
jgi:hypothetical protein